MGDFTRNFFLDPGITIKEEPIRDDNGSIITTTTNPLMNTTASVPIPTRRIMEISDYRDFGIEFDNSQSPLYQDITINNSNNIIMNDTSIWGNRLIINEDELKNEALIHMDDDDIFQVDKADLIQGPTLAELNANDDNLLSDLNFDDLLLPEEGRSGSDTTTYLATTLSSLINKNLTTITATTTTNTTSTTTPPFVQIHNSNHINNNNSIVTVASSCPQTTSIFYKDLDLSSSVPTNHYDLYNNSTPVSTFSPNSQTSSSSSLLQTSSSPLHMNSLQQKHSTLHELLLKNSERNSLTPPATTAVTISTTTNSPQPQQQQQLQRTPSTSPNIIRMHHRTHISRLSSSAPTHLGLEQLWQRREPRKHLLSTGSLVEAGSTSSLSTGGVLSPDPQDFSHDEFDSDEESDNHYEDMSSENESDDDDQQHHNNIKHHNYSNTSNNHNHQKKERYFWQYNVQAKGPKGQRLVMKSKMEDPHILNEVTDPVFSPDCSLRGIKHSGKARKGDGNDLTPNARKLFNIGKELDKLGRIINDMTPVSELPFNVRPKSRKEKNKLASRACRLKKKAQHEANKIKLNGLEIEHKNLLNAIQQCRELLMLKLQETSIEKQEELTAHVENICKIATRLKVAGYTTDYVNKILDKLKKRQPLTGLEDGV